MTGRCLSRHEANRPCSAPSPGSRSGPAGIATAWTFCPVRATGTVGPTATARKGSAPVASSQRPSHPDAPGEAGIPDCQMSIDWKWLKFGLAKPTPCTMAIRFSSQSRLNPGILGWRPKPSPSGSTVDAALASVSNRSPFDFGGIQRARLRLVPLGSERRLHQGRPSTDVRALRATISHHERGTCTHRRGPVPHISGLAQEGMAARAGRFRDGDSDRWRDRHRGPDGQRGGRPRGGTSPPRRARVRMTSCWGPTCANAVQCWGVGISIENINSNGAFAPWSKPGMGRRGVWVPSRHFRPVRAEGSSTSPACPDPTVGLWARSLASPGTGTRRARS